MLSLIDEVKVYVGFDASGLFKIGITRNAKARLSQFRTGNPSFQFLCVFERTDAMLSESDLHEMFEEKRVAGEWFALSASDLKQIIHEFTAEPFEKLDSIDALWDGIANKKMASDPDFIKYMLDKETWL